MDQPQSQKQKRSLIVSQACDLCRIRKMRCDAGLPCFGRKRPAGNITCSKCDRLGLTCTFDKPVRKRGPLSRSAKSEVHAARKSGINVLEHPARLSASVRSIVNTSASYSETQTSQSPPSIENAFTKHRSPSGAGSAGSPICRDAREALTAEYATDCICSRSIFEEMVQHFLDRLYATLPHVHRPTFIADFKARREESDPSFLALLIGMVAIVAATSARVFDSYRLQAPSFPFQSRTAIVSHCFKEICKINSGDDVCVFSYNDWAAQLLIGSALYQLKSLGWEEFQNASKVFLNSARYQRFHDIRTYEDLDCIQLQLRKKAFWQTFMIYVHQEMDSNFHGVKIFNRSDFEGLSLDFVMPIEVDDEFITASQVFPQPEGQTSVTVGFNANCLVYWCSMFPASPYINVHGTAGDVERKLLDLKARMDSVQFCLDDYLPKFCQWTSSTRDTSSHKLSTQWGSMRANCLISQLWLLISLFEQMVTLSKTTSFYRPELDMLRTDETIWAFKENIYRQLLQTLYSLSEDKFEPTGNFSVRKIRAIAATLLDCSIEKQTALGQRIDKYMPRLIDMLTKIDNSDMKGMAVEPLITTIVPYPSQS